MATTKKEAPARVLGGMAIRSKAVQPKKRGSGMGDVKAAEYDLEAERATREAKARMRRKELQTRGNRMA